MKRLALIAIPLLVGCRPRQNVEHYENARHAAPIDVSIAWLVAFLILGFGVSVAAAVWVPSPAMKKTAVASALGFLASLALALCVQAIRPYMPWIALGLFLLGGVAAIIHFRRELMADLVSVKVTPA